MVRKPTLAVRGVLPLEGNIMPLEGNMPRQLVMNLAREQLSLQLKIE
jgi:hypothetical protein